MDIIETSAITGETVERNYTAKEKTERDLSIAEFKAKLEIETAEILAKETAKSAILAKLGITAAELKIALS